MPKDISFKQLEKEFQKGGRIYEAANFDKKTWKILADDHVRQMKVRAYNSKQLSEPKHGSSVRGMKPLRPKTIQARRRKGVSGFGATPEKSSLSETGKMLRDMSWRPIKRGIEFFFKSEESNERAYWHNFQGTSKSERYFFWFSNKQLKDIKKYIIRKFNDNLRKR